MSPSRAYARGMDFTADVARGDWIASRLQGWGVVGGTVPRGFEAYARVFHPVPVDRVLSRDPTIETEGRLSTWREVTERFGTTWHPLMQWHSITRDVDEQIDIGDGWRMHDPQVGRLELSTLAALVQPLAAATTAPDDVVAAIWNGWGELHPSSGATLVATRDAADERPAAVPTPPTSLSPTVTRAAENGPTLSLPGRDYVLLQARLEEFGDPSWVDGAGIGWLYGYGPTPNLLWPEDHAWLVATEIDFDSTIVGGSRALINAILVAPGIEAVEVGADDSLAFAADTVNEPPAD